MYFYNNEAQYNTGTGVFVGSGASTVYVSGSNPWNPSDPPHYAYNNAYNGIWFEGSTNAVTLDGVRVCSNGNGAGVPPGNGYGVDFQSTSNLNLINGAVMSGNSPQNMSIAAPAGYTITSCPTTGL